jgi:hypothetical protein
MLWVPGGSFRMGSADFYPEERPVHRVTVDGYWIDVHPVTVAGFRRFVKATGHVTSAETAPDPADYPGADPELLVPGSLVFQPTSGPVALNDFRNWWAWVPGADWRHPEGPGSTLDGRQRHPVTHVAYADALAAALEQITAQPAALRQKMHFTSHHVKVACADPPAISNELPCLLGDLVCGLQKFIDLRYLGHSHELHIPAGAQSSDLTTAVLPRFRRKLIHVTRKRTAKVNQRVGRYPPRSIEGKAFPDHWAAA